MKTKRNLRHLGKLVFALILSCQAALQQANATLESKDLSSAGDGSLTYDTATGLSWLDIPLTANHSYDEVLSGFGGYTTQMGFRFATADELGQLFLDAGITQGNIWGYWDFNNPYFLASASLVSLIGVTYPYDGLSIGTYGLTSGATLGSAGHHDFAVVSYNSHADSYTFQAISALDDSARSPYIGSFLIRNATPVPEPSSALLMLAAVTTLAVGTYRRNVRAMLREMFKSNTD